MSDVFKRHREKIARDTLRMSDAIAGVMGGMTKAEARRVLAEALGREPTEQESENYIIANKADQCLEEHQRRVLADSEAGTVCGATGTEEHAPECGYIAFGMWDCGKDDTC
jgi:hypothetical protein